MSTKLGTLTLDLVTKIGNFVGPIKEGEKQVKVSFENMSKQINSYSQIAVAGAAAVGIGVVAMANDYANAARELQTFASISNATTQEFQKMAAGAETMGISPEKLADQLKDFNEKLGEFITIGSGGAVDFFEKIAVKTEDSAEAARKLALEMQSLSGPQALQLYVDKLEEAGVTQQQMSFYLESMASDTTNLIPLLKNGGEGFKFWADAAQKAGIVMDQHAIAKANELKIQIDLLNMQVQGAKNQFIQGLMPALVAVGDAMTDVTVETNLMSDAGETLGGVFKGVAATGMGVYAVVKMLSNAIAGLSFDAINAKKNVDLASQDGSWANKLPGIRLAKTLITGAAVSRAPNSGISMAAADNSKVVDDIGTSISALFNNTVNQTTAAMAKLQNSQAGVISGSDEWIKKQNEAANAAKQTSKAIADQNRAYEEAQRLIYEYGSEFNRIDMDLSDERGRINNSALKVGSKIKMIADAQEISDARKKLYATELDYELNQYHMTEQEKLKAQLSINLLKLDATKGLLDSERKLKKDALEKQAATEESALKISQQKQLLETKRNWMSATEYAQEYYALVREEILNTASYSPEKKEALLQQASSDQNIEQSYERDNAISDYRGVMGFDESPLIQQFEVLDKMRELDLLNEEAYQNAKLQLQMQSTESYMEGMFGGFAELVDENSKTYAVLFAAQRAFAVAQAMLNIPAAYSKAYDAVVGTPYIGPYIAPVVGAAAAALQVAQAAKIKGVSLTGMAHDGIDNVPREGTWLLDKGERVLNARQNKDLTSYLNQMGSQSPKSQSVESNVRVAIFDDRADMMNQMYGREGEKVVMYHLKRNGMLKA
ncbi:hypothetical protein D3C78_165780 [compost metagenome]